jgi:hypothetical protein
MFAKSLSARLSLAGNSRTELGLVGTCTIRFGSYARRRFCLYGNTSSRKRPRYLDLDDMVRKSTAVLE